MELEIDFIPALFSDALLWAIVGGLWITVVPALVLPERNVFFEVPESARWKVVVGVCGCPVDPNNLVFILF